MNLQNDDGMIGPYARAVMRHIEWCATVPVGFLWEDDTVTEGVMAQVPFLPNESLAKRFERAQQIALRAQAAANL
jgi:hypothetical protein